MRLIQLFESLQTSQDIKKCSAMVFDKFLNVVYQDILTDFPMKEDLDFIISYETIMLSDLNSSVFGEEFKDFIANFPVEIMLISDDGYGGKGRWLPQGKQGIIYLNFVSEIEKFRESILSQVMAGKSFDKVLLDNFLKTRLYVLQHEIQHAFDDYRSDRKFTDKRAVGFDVASDPIKYVNFSHEISAHYTQAINEVTDKLLGNSSKYDRKQLFKYAIEAFKQHMAGYDHLPPKIQQRLLNRASVEIQQVIN